MRAEAAAWIARLHGPGRTRETEDGFRRWLAAHPVHAIEFELATDVWNDTDGLSLPQGVPPGPSSEPRGHRSRRGWILSAGCVACLLIAVWMVHGLGPSSVSTGIGERKTLELADGSRVTLNTDSRIVVHYSKRSRTVYLRYGEAYFQVVHNPKWPFVVRAGERRIIDVGTSFMVRRNAVGAGSLSVTVIEGQVAVTPLEVASLLSRIPPIKALYVGAGKRLLLRPHARPQVEDEPAGQATAWLRGQLVFKDISLAEAAAQFNRYNATKIILRASRLRAIRVSGQFRTTAAESFAQSVAEAHHLRLIAQGHALILEPGH